jgi:cell division transport system permease protein
MAQTSKAAARRGKPSYIMSIIGVTLVLFLLGIVGWLLINGTKLGDYFRSNIEVRAYLNDNITSADSTALLQELAAKPYMKSYDFVNKEEARKLYQSQENEFPDSVIGYNPLPNAVFFRVKKEYVQVDSLEKIRQELKGNHLISGVLYPRDTVENLNKNLERLSLALLIIAIVIAVSVIFLIDNTIRLAMFSNRFLIKTMQMVGATRWFIAKPLNIRAVINGAISAAIAIVLVLLLISTAQNYWPDLAALRDTKMLILLFVVLLILGISITLFSTYRSVLKYLRMKLDELY